MLAVCLHKLCPKGRFANAFRKVEKCVNISLRRVENRPGEGPKWPPGGLRKALGRQVGRQGRSETSFGRLLDRPRRPGSAFQGRRNPPGATQSHVESKKSSL